MKIKKGVIIQKLGDRYIAFDNERSELHELNEVGFFILSLIEKGKSQTEIVEMIIDRYQIEKGKVKKDLNEFYQDLEQRT